MSTNHKQLYIYIYLFSWRFYPKRLTIVTVYMSEVTHLWSNTLASHNGSNPCLSHQRHVFIHCAITTLYFYYIWDM